MAPASGCTRPRGSGASASGELQSRGSDNAGASRGACTRHNLSVGSAGAAAHGAAVGVPPARAPGCITDDGAALAGLPHDSDSGASSTAPYRDPSLSCVGGKLIMQPLTPFAQLRVRPCPGRVTHFHCKGCGRTLRKHAATTHFTIEHGLQHEDMAKWLVVDDGADLGPQPQRIIDRLETAYLKLALSMGVCDVGWRGADVGADLSAAALPGQSEKRGTLLGHNGGCRIVLPGSGSPS